jgi:hypothetical protein
VVEAVCVIVPDAPVTVSVTANGFAESDVLIVSVDDPEPVIVDGLKPPLATPAGNPESTVTLRLTGALNPASGVTVTVNGAGCPAATVRADGLTDRSKSGDGGVTVTIRMGGLGSELPLASIAVIETV